MASSTYSTNSLAKDAVNKLTSVINGLKVNDLASYINTPLRNDFITDEDYIRSRMDEATRTAYDVQRATALQDAANAEDTNYTNTRNAVSELRRALIGSGSSGANVGAANASALQAILGLGQQNTQLTTEGLRNINNMERERTAAMAANALNAITAKNEATSRMYDAGTSAYASDRSYGAQGASTALGALLAAADTNASQERINNATNASQIQMNNDTNKNNLQIEKTTKTTKNYNYSK